MTPASLWQHPNLELLVPVELKTLNARLRENDLAQPSRARMSVALAHLHRVLANVAMRNGDSQRIRGIGLRVSGGASATCAPYAEPAFLRATNTDDGCFTRRAAYSNTGSS